MERGREEEVKELKQFLHVIKDKQDSEEVAIIFDGKQFSVRIPKRFTDAVEIKPRVDAFIFRLLLPPPYTKEQPKLTGELVREMKGK